MIELLIQWEILVIPVIVLSISQLTKVSLQAVRDTLDWRELNSYGGMPSSHTALFVSLTTIIGLTQGVGSPIFGITAFISAVFIRDAVGIRWSLGHHGKVLNRLVETLPEELRGQFPEKLQERLGHTPLEAIVGFILGLVLTFLLHWLLAGLA